ncbi:MAG: hypothetical protein ACRC20_17155 [Segniliparus sp.]|uniref:hypothetical protein n=1 Tax=Segniliparus sp. TaxID=2804064 RepID=UPI003F362A5C
MGILEIASHDLLTAWQYVHEHGELGVAVGFAGFVLGRLDRRGDRQEKRKEAATREAADLKAAESDRVTRFIASLRAIEEARDPFVLNKAATHARSLARKPKPVAYRSDLTFGLRQDGKFPRYPDPDWSEERFVVELKHYSNPVAPIPHLAKPFPYSKAESFPGDIPKEWLPKLVDAIISTLPARFPDYHGYTEASPYSDNSPRETIRRIASLAKEVEQSYLHTNLGAVAEFVANTYANHWSKLAEAIRSLLIDRGKEFPHLGVAFLQLAASGEKIKAYWPNLVRLAIVLGVSDSVRWMEPCISEEQKDDLAPAYVSILHYGVFGSLWANRFWHHGTYCHRVDFDAEESDGRTLSVERFEIAKDYSNSCLSIDEVIVSSVCAMGIVAEEPPSGQEDDRRLDAMEIVRSLAGTFRRYAPNPHVKRTLKSTGVGMGLNGQAHLEHDRIDNFVEGIHALGRRWPNHPEFDGLVESASILLPDIRQRLQSLAEDEPSEPKTS